MNRPSLLRVAVAVPVLVAVVAGGVLATCRGGGSDLPPSSNQLVLQVPEVIQAGATVEVEITGLDDRTEEVVVLAESLAGVVRRQASVSEGRGRVSFAATATSVAGPLVIWASTADDQAAATIDVVPGPVVDPVVPLVGPKSIVADGIDHAMVVAFPADIHGNPVPDRRRTRLDVVRTTGARGSAPAEVTGLAVWWRVTASTTAGPTVVSTSLDDADGPAADLDEVAGPPVHLALRPTEGSVEPLVADGRRLHGLVTEPIADRFGNVVPDGTAVQFRLTDPSGTRQATAVTIGGIAELFVEAPELPGALVATATVAGATSEAIQLEFTPAPTEVPAVVRVDQGRWVVVVGPVVSTLGGWVPDGTSVTYLDAADGRADGVLEGGVATIDLDGEPGPGAAVVVLGVRGEVSR